LSEERSWPSSSPRSLRLIRSWSMEVLPTRSPIPKGGAVDAVGAVFEGGEGVGEGEAAVVVAVPVDAHRDAQRADEVAGEEDEVADAVGGGVADGVAEAEARCAVVDGAAKRVARVWGRERMVSSVTKVTRRPALAAERHGGGDEGEHAVEVPVLGVAADGAGADEGHDLDGVADLLGDVDDGLGRRWCGCERRRRGG
jgi:hypothetical protein